MAPTEIPSGASTPLLRVLGPKTSASIARELQIETVGALLDHFPRRYVERGELTRIAELPSEEHVTLVARVERASTRKMQRRKGFLTEVVVTDDSQESGGTLAVSFFNSRKAAADLVPGCRVMLAGRVTSYRDEKTLSHPDFEIFPAERSIDPVDLRPIPIYPATKSLPSWRIRRAVDALLELPDLRQMEDPLPVAVRVAEKLEPLDSAYRDIHQPVDLPSAHRARHRFRYQEAFLLQTALAVRRAARLAQPSRARPASANGVLEAFDARLPFSLTAGQEEVGAEISAELGREQPMNRLLQGEVGTGKTVVALRAMLQVVDAGGQVAFLAPTEVLAEQHLRSLRDLLGALGEAGTLGAADRACGIALLTGSMRQQAKKKVLLDIASGGADIVVGTHALLSDTVRFAELGLLVVDEQHRFGVEQRDALRTRSEVVPHVLVMTATPIPRTLAMTVFGDLETSLLTELPQGRQPLATHLVALAEHPDWEDRLWRRSREEVDAGRQVFVVCPRIGDEDGARADDSTASVTAVLQQLREHPALRSRRIEALHGGMDPESKEAVMFGFGAGTVDLVVATTVVEVGVNVPNATLMVVLDADRFGVAQLHQLRGRVGRGAHAGTCLLVTRLPPGHASRERLDVVACTTDGTRLAEYDVEQRKEGDILGASQAGHGSTLRLLRVVRDGPLIEKARGAARELVRDDPGLVRHPALAGVLERLDEERKDYLERS
ncbi:ATP-dependent DNA helicase RecG [Arthrobacter sp. KK5.5]|uniref:ATP-dependent DNA helicase RecG n=1 Tax=Arthrobacter sp. KK5.5 TaxID=3373084 RepID=UPI003EE7EE55